MGEEEEEEVDDEKKREFFVSQQETRQGFYLPKMLINLHLMWHVVFHAKLSHLEFCPAAS